MNSISPQMLGLAVGDLALVKASGAHDEQAGARPAALRRLLRLAIRWRWLLIGGVVGGAVLGLLVTALATRQYASTVRLQIARETAQVVNVGALSRDVSPGDQEFYQTQYGLLRAQALAERVARDLGVVDDPAFFRMFGRGEAYARNPGAEGRRKRNEIAGQILLSHVIVAPINGSSLVDVRATTPSPELSEQVARTWGQDFIASNLERRMGASGYARRFLESRIDQLREKLENSERRVVEYAATQGIVDLPWAGSNPKSAASDSTQNRSLLTDDLSASNAVLVAATADRIQAGSRLAAADREPDSSSDALNYRAIGNLRKQRADAAAEYAKLVAHVPPDDASAKAVRAQIDAFDAAIQSERTRVRTALQQTYDAALAREQALTQRVDALKRSLATERQRSIQYNIYQRDADTNRELYDALLQRYKEIDVAGAAENNNVAIVDPARLPDRPSSPRLALNLVLFMLAGGLFGAVGALGLHHIDNGVSDPREFEDQIGLPLLGVAPKLKAEPPLQALKNPRSPFVEAHVMIEANLELSTAQGAPKSLAILSTRGGEGKTTTAIALAQTLARARRKVVLIDANLRAPAIHAALGLKNVAGVADLLSGGGDIDAVLQATGYEGLSAITAGAPQANPTDLLIGERLARLVKDLQDRFDRVIVDGPPVIGLADAQFVALAVEGVVYAVAARSTPAGAVRTALRRLNRDQLTGGVLTMFEGRPGRAGFG